MLRNFYASAVLLLSIACSGAILNAQTVTMSTNVGDVVINLFPDDAPISVDNFLGYVNRGDYTGTIMHRSDPGFVVQGGGFMTDGAGISLQPAIQNEFGRSNLRGTVAYARVGGNVNSATSQFFFNLSDSNNFLDGVDEGFTVFGEVVSGMDVVDSITGLQIVNAGGPFGELPVLESFDGVTIFASDLVVINSTAVGPPFVLGDVSGDGMVNFLDISAFIGVLSVGDFQNEADIDRDGQVNFLDIAAFIALLGQ